ncbi:serine/threonine-protein kinase [Streptomyces sp. SAI-133]|uniref:serine/threonine-protein kinase n=1 Tax=Streptomyces sp. SAI-133 TaxID=2940547 RepID=UPI002475CAF7|nr:serine/threonine-protein kinase [Streptomyces sp. SAI-133]
MRQLGEGGMGQVWEAQDETLDRSVAVKVISLLAGGGSRGDEVRARFLREARITARLQHPNIVTIHDLGETGAGNERVPFLVMELVRGEGLDTMLRRGVVTLADAARWGALISDALAAAHAAGIMHRDIKPSNILIMPSGTVKVLDFGIARAADPYATTDRLTQTGFIVGTPPYMAPEQARGFPEPRSDLYALGCLLFELITGQLPFQAPDTVGYLSAHLTQEPPAPSSVSTSVPSGWDDLVLRLLHKDPTQRYPNAADLSQALRQLDRAPEPESPAADRTRPFTTPGTTPLPPALSTTGANSVPPQPGTAPTIARARPDGPLTDRNRPTPERFSGSTATAAIALALLCLLTIPVIPIATDQAVKAGLTPSSSLTLQMTLCGVQTVLLAIGALLLRMRKTAGRWLIAAGGTGLALQAVYDSIVFFDAIALVLRGVLPMTAATAAAAVITAVLPSTGLSRGPGLAAPSSPRLAPEGPGRRAQWERFGPPAAVFVLINVSSDFWLTGLGAGSGWGFVFSVWLVRFLMVGLLVFTAALTPHSKGVTRGVGYVFAFFNAIGFVLGVTLGAGPTLAHDLPLFCTAIFMSVASYCYRDFKTRRIRSADN